MWGVGGGRKVGWRNGASFGAPGVPTLFAMGMCFSGANHARSCAPARGDHARPSVGSCAHHARIMRRVVHGRGWPFRGAWQRAPNHARSCRLRAAIVRGGGWPFRAAWRRAPNHARSCRLRAAIMRESPWDHARIMRTRAAGHSCLNENSTRAQRPGHMPPTPIVGSISRCMGWDIF